MSDPSKQERIEELLRKSLLGEELINTQFHLFSARSSPSGQVLKPRVLCANNVLLAKSSTYFLDLLSTDINPSDPSLVDLTDDNDVPSSARIDDYGYASDSDLEDLLSDDGSESVSSDMFVMSPEQPRTDEPLPAGKGSAASSETAVQGGSGNKNLGKQTAVRLRSLASRHVLVKDSAFQTWYALLNYLYTDKFNFMPLGSTTPGGQPHESLIGSLDEPRCSAKSTYRLASKVGLDHLRDEAFSYIQSNLTEHNILQELSCSLVSTHPQLLEMALDVLYSHIASPPVVAHFSDLARRIANKELSHGADIVVGVHARLLREPHPLPLKPAPSLRCLLERPGLNAVEGDASDVPRDENEDGDRDDNENWTISCERGHPFRSGSGNPPRGVVRPSPRAKPLAPPSVKAAQLAIPKSREEPAAQAASVSPPEDTLAGLPRRAVNAMGSRSSKARAASKNQ
ncbi:hypothetical protein HD554DRAFT_2029541 [Boletus coccyginus]|nr:hypothetical protein HD554DRAFT_2029541 [Boletus coccyginus]